jgi:catechol 2,3-dioxygenase-like lactoylglutathione lyase family enzyme
MSYAVLATGGGRMIKLDHLTIAVSDCDKSREWYVKTLGLKLEFEIPERRTAAVQDEFDFTLFLAETPGGPGRPSCVLTFQVADVEAHYKTLSAAGVTFVHPPQKTFWGYGSELKDPDGYRIWLWDEKTMREKGEI